MNILIAPDKFKGSLRATEVADAIARGARRALPHASVELRPVADGGDGTIDALVASLGGTVTSVRVPGPLGAPVDAPLARLGDGRLVLEVARASGLVLVDEDERDAARASSRGTGELLRAALEGGDAREVIVAVGGSASTDGGSGAATAVGWRFLDRRGRELSPGGGALTDLHRIDGTRVSERVRAASVLGACDVGNPLLGDSGAARTFAPQKGAGAAEVDKLEDGLATLAARMGADLGLDVASRWGAGACGGLGAGLIAFFGATLSPGFDLVADAVGLASAMVAADVVVTGEGRLDAQSASGKAPAGVSRLARARGIPCIVVAGDISLAPGELEAMGFVAGASLIAEVGPRRALGDTEAALEEVVERLLERTARR
ncbi:glycerate kinase [soil metagenome]